MQRPALSRPLALMLIASYLGACHHYVGANDMGPAAYMAQKQPKRIRVTLKDSSQVELGTPWITTDSVGGMTGGFSRWDEEVGRRVEVVGEPWSSSREQVARIEVYKTNAPATAGLVLGLAAGAFAVLMVVAIIGYCSSAQCSL